MEGASQGSHGADVQWLWERVNQDVGWLGWVGSNVLLSMLGSIVGPVGAVALVVLVEEAALELLRGRLRSKRGR